MSVYTRRDVLFGAFQGKEKECHDNATLKKIAKVSVGRLKDYPVGSHRVLSEWGVIIDSLPEGLRVISAEDEDRCYAVQVSSQGELEIDFERLCSRDTVFSVLTNEPIRLY